MTSEAQLRAQILAKIASGEAERYNELYGGGSFDSYAQHPDVAIPLGNGTHTTAAGRYQFLSSTWTDEAKRLGLSDFSPASQDAAAWDLADRTYRAQTGRSILDDQANGTVDWHALSGQWTSLRGKGVPSGSDSTPVGTDSSSSQQLQVQPDGNAGAADSENQMKNLALLQSLSPHLTFTPVDYDPFKVAGASS